LTVCCGQNETELERRAANIGRAVGELRANALAGLPNEVVDRLVAYREAGAETAYLQVLDLNDHDHIRLLAAEVLPKVALL
jgi:alkanesulfonate monooxygenase SsuD/methylene tetrahydromethanopterin reductase-like flavin-dependent oxidoreductase (luciferase family)